MAYSKYRTFAKLLQLFGLNSVVFKLSSWEKARANFCE
jgi:hypothetical protein